MNIYILKSFLGQLKIPGEYNFKEEITINDNLKGKCFISILKEKIKDELKEKYSYSDQKYKPREYKYNNYPDIDVLEKNIKNKEYYFFIKNLFCLLDKLNKIGYVDIDEPLLLIIYDLIKEI